MRRFIMDIQLFILNNLSSVFVFCVTIILVYLHTRRRSGVPPGPPCLPIIGNLGSLAGADTLKNLKNLREKYGDICGLYIGSDLHILLSGYDVINEALLKRGKLFSRRPTNAYTEKMHRKVAIVFGNDESWKELRIFTLNALRDLCFRKTGITFEDRVHDEVAHLIQRLLEYKTETSISSVITLSFANIVHSILHGCRVGYDDKKFLGYQDLLDDAFKSHMRTKIVNHCFPFLHYLPGDLLREKHTDAVVKNLTDYCTDVWQGNFENYKPGDKNCFIDLWIDASNAQGDVPSAIFNSDKLYSVYHDLMGAGSETSATTLKWIVLALVKHPYIQKKLQTQVDSVIGKDHTPTMSDRERLPYVEATILEGLRFGTPVPLSIPHAVSHDTTFKGYLIPKEASILPNLISVHYDPSIFPDPETFKPERFLNEDETVIVGTEKLIPFSLGPRSCIGETLARTELLLYLATLIQKVEFLAPESEELPSMKGLIGLTHRPQEYKVKVLTRKTDG